MNFNLRIRSRWQSSCDDSKYRVDPKQVAHSGNYAYDNLATPATFRILALDAGSESEPLQGQLIHVDIESPRRPSFVALSYVWGDPMTERKFCCRSRATTGVLQITRSLEEALKQFRLRHGTLHIWADAICIDQDNLQERSEQVRLMDQIYSSAKRVLIWLGCDPKNDAHIAFEVLEKLGLDYASYTHRFGMHSATDDHTLRALSAINELAQREYFQRVWVMQEAVLGKQTLVHWGLARIDLRALSAGLAWIVRMSELGAVHSQTFSWASSLHLHSAEKRFGTFQVLQWVRSRSCADDRDRIYAILGMPFDQRNFWHDCLKGLLPDYTVSLLDMYIDVACRAIAKGGLIPLLNSVHQGPNLGLWERDTWPSWVPKWNEDHARNLFINPTDDSCNNIAYGIDTERKTTNVKCVRIDHIIDISSNDLLWPSSDLNIQSICAFWDQLIGHTEMKPPPVKRWTRLMLCNVLSAQMWHKRTDHSKRSFSRPEHDSADDELYGVCLVMHTLHWEYIYQDLSKTTKGALETLLYLLHQCRYICMHRSKGANKRDWQRPGLVFPEVAWLNESTSVEMIRPPQRFKIYLRGRRLFVTQRGQVGLGPEAMRAGDEIVILEGSDVPFVLRAQDEDGSLFHQVVGAAYIPRSMVKDSTGQAKEEGAHMEMLELR
jgi:hypothetical protein